MNTGLRNEKPYLTEHEYMSGCGILWVSVSNVAVTPFSPAKPLFFHHYGDPVDGGGIFLIWRLEQEHSLWSPSNVFYLSFSFLVVQFLLHPYLC